MNPITNLCTIQPDLSGTFYAVAGVNITLDRSSLLVLENKTSVEFCLLKSRQTSVNITAVVNPTQVLDDLSSGSGQLGTYVRMYCIFAYL